MSKYMQFAKCLRNANAPLVLSIGAVLLLALAALVGARGSTQAQSLDMETAKYEITFTGLFDGDALSAGTAVPANAGFSVMVGGAHNSSVTYWSAGAAASSGLERLAEDGATTDFREEINASVNAGNGKGSFVYTGTDLPPTGDRAILFKTTRDFPLVTLAAKVEPSPDWFVGVSGLDLRPNGEWEREVSVDLYPWDAGTEGGSQFSDGFPATNPQGRISSLRNTDRFSDGPIARVTFTLREPPKVKGVRGNPGDGWIDVSWNEIDVATGYKVQWKSGNQGFGNAASDGREALVEDGKTVRHAILELTNGTEYTVRVVATNPMGDGRPSEQVRKTPVEGTGEDILVSNVAQNTALTAPLTISAATPQYVQTFRTGARPAPLGGVILPGLNNVESGSEISVSLYSEKRGAPGTLLKALVAPAALSTGADAVFAAPSGTAVSLAPNTTYILQIDHVAGSLSLSFTKSDGEDPETDTGWSLGDACQAKNAGASAFSTCLFSKALRVSIGGPSSAALPVVGVADAVATEGSNLEFTVALSKPAPGEVTVQYDTADGTASSDAQATDGADYTAAAGQTLTFTAGVTEQTISIATGDDTVDEDDETFTLTLSNPSENAALGSSSTASGTMVNNDETALTDATLSALTLTDGNGIARQLTPSFDRYIGLYMASVGNDVASLTASATRNESGATMVFVDADDTSTPGEAGYDLEVGNNLVKVMVTSEDGNRVKIYMVNVIRTPSDDATLSDATLTDSSGTAIDLSPATFNPGTMNYTASVDFGVDSATVSVSKNHGGASVLMITADGTQAAETATIDLAPGDSFIKIMVTAEDGVTSLIYNLFVTRVVTGLESDATLSGYALVDSDGADVLLSSTFGPNDTLYYAWVPNDITSVTATATPTRSGSTLAFHDGNATGTPGQVTRDLEVGGNRVKVIVTSEDGLVNRIYIILVQRAASDASSDATLSALTLTDASNTAVDLTPAFSAGANDYTAAVANEVNSVEVVATTTDTDAVALIFREDGTHEDLDATVGLAVGENLIKVMVIAEDASTTDIYNVTVTRAASENSDDATLSDLSLTDDNGTAIDLVPAFDPATADYTASVASDIESVTLTATKNHGGATAVIIEADGTSTADAATVDLGVGSNLIKAMVTSEDGTDSRIYTVTVTRAGSAYATLSDLVLEESNGSEILLSPSFASDQGLYTALVASAVESLTATATKNHAGATVVFIGDDDTTTPEETTQSLVVGSNLVKAMVTAEDGATIKIYMVTVTRAAAGASDDAALSALTLSDANGSAIELTPQFDAAITNYTASIPFSVGQITASATRSHSGAWALVFGQDGTNAQNQRTLDVAVGENLIKVMVTAEDGATSKIYMVTATRAATASEDATLSALHLEGDGGATIDLTPAFDAATATYSAEVANSIRSIDVSAVENYSTASAVIIEADGTSTPDVATIDLDVGDNLVKVMVTAEDGATVLIYQITVTRAAGWSATLTVGVDNSYVPPLTGYTLWGTDIGGVSEQSFVVDGSGYRVVGIIHSVGGLYLNVSREHPGDFTLTIGDQEFVASESLKPATVAAGRYWWAVDDMGWADGDTLDVSIVPVAGSESLPERSSPPPAGYFADVPSSHNGVDPFTVGLRFTEDVPMSFRTLRDHALSATNGAITKARRATQGSDRVWNITVRPDSAADIVVTLQADPGCAADGSICTADGTELINSPAVTIAVQQ